MSSKDLDEARDRTPVSISIPLEPVLDGSADSATKAAGLRATGFASRPTTLGQCVSNHSEISAEYRRKYDAGDQHAIGALLRLNPDFVRDPWVREALERQALSAGRSQRKRGRPSGPTADTVQVGLALVVVVNDQVTKHGKSVERVLQDLADRRFEGLSYDRLKQLYYQMRDDPRFRAILFTPE